MRADSKLLVATIAILGSLVSFQAAAATPKQTSTLEMSTNSPAASKSNLLQPVVVSASYARSLESALNIKRYSPVIVDAISLANMGQLPNVNVASALARLPGIATERDPNTNSSSQIAIGGMPEELTLGEMNGDSLATSTSTGNIRYDMFPPSLIGTAVVYKTPMASLNSGGIAGTVELRTIRPLKFPRNTILASVEGDYSSLGGQLARASDMGWRADLAYVGKAFHDKLGFALGVALRSDPIGYVESEFDQYDPSANYEDLTGNGKPITANYGVFAGTAYGVDKRQGLMAALQWRPSRKLSVYLDGFYSHGLYTELQNGFLSSTANGEFTNSYTNVTAADQELTSATITEQCTYGCALGQQDGITLQNFAAASTRDDTFDNIGTQIAWHPTRQDTIKANLAWSHDDYLSYYPTIETDYVQLVNGVPTNVANGQSLTEDALTSPPQIATNDNLSNPNLNRVASLQVPYAHDGHDTIYQEKLSFTHAFRHGLVNSLSVGVRAVEHRKSNIQLSETSTIAVPNQTVLPASELESPALGTYAFPAIPSFMSFNFNSALVHYFGPLNLQNNTTSDATGSWTIENKTLAAFVQANYEGRLFGWPFEGNIGVRAVRTLSTSSSEQQDPITSLLVPYSVVNDYTNVLPSFNFNYRPWNKWVFRFSAAEAIARPQMDYLNAGFTTYCAGGPGVSCQAYGGNPNLKPFKDKQVALDAEYYYAKNSYTSLSLYYRDLSTWISTSQKSVAVGGVNYQFFQPVNQSGGYVASVDYTIQDQFNWLPSPLNGLGVYATVAYNDTNIKNSADYSTETSGLLGLSKYTYTTTMYYSKGPLDAHVSYEYRSAFPRTLPGEGLFTGFATDDGAGYLDAQVSYQLGMGVSMVVSGENLTETPYRTSYSNGANGSYQQYGRMFYFGFTYRG
jgi:TonB-dependent receptor